LGVKNKIPWRRPATSFQKKDHSHCCKNYYSRVAAPEIFRTLFHPKDSVQKILCDLANWKTDIATSSLTGANWQHQEFDKQNLIVGWLHLTTKEAQLLLEHSGKKGFFVSEQQAGVSPKPIFWIDKIKGEAPDDYFRRAKTAAADKKQHLIFRKSTTTGLGYPCDQTDKTQKRIHITIGGLPPEWRQSHPTCWQQSQPRNLDL